VIKKNPIQNLQKSRKKIRNELFIKNNKKKGKKYNAKHTLKKADVSNEISKNSFYCF